MIDYSEPDTFHGPVGASVTQVGNIARISVPLLRKINDKFLEVHVFIIGNQVNHELVDVTAEVEANEKARSEAAGEKTE